MKTKPFLFMSLVALVLPAIFASCGDDEPESAKKPSLSQTTLSLTVKETKQLTYSGGNAVWGSDNPLIATVDNGLVKGVCAGTTVVRANDLACAVTVKPRYSIFDEPYLQWGASETAVNNYMRKLSFTANGGASSDVLSFSKNGRTWLYLYMFDGGKLKSVAVATDINEAVTFADFLMDRYFPLGEETDEEGNYNLYYVSPDTKILVMQKLTLKYSLTIFAPYTPDKGKGLKDINKDTVKKYIKDIKGFTHNSIKQWK